MNKVTTMGIYTLTAAQHQRFELRPLVFLSVLRGLGFRGFRVESLGFRGPKKCKDYVRIHVYTGLM